ncbi:MAG TPA: TIM-barrel domain-containing protein [Candidatus Dormibacteraeota bacterium]
MPIAKTLSSVKGRRPPGAGPLFLLERIRRPFLAIPRGFPHPALEPPPETAWQQETIPASALSPIRAVQTSSEPAGDGSLHIRFEAAGAGGLVVRFGASPGERFWGFGERSDQVTRTAGEVENWVGEGPYQLEEYPLLAATTPRWALRQRRDAAYYPVPWLISSAGYAVLIENSELSWWRLPGRPRTWACGVLAPSIRLRLFEAPTPAGLLAKLTAATGRQPFPAAPWFLGPWVQTGHASLVPLNTEREIVERLRAVEAPVSAIETHMRRLPGGDHEGRRSAERARTALFHEYGLASLTYLNPFVSEDYRSCFSAALEDGALQRREDGTAYLYPAYIGGRVPPLTTEGQLDFSTDAAQAIFDRLAREAVEDGHDGWMEDFGEYTPPDAVEASGLKGVEAHNRYPVAYHTGAELAAARTGHPALARFGRSGWTGAARHLPLVWGGDPTTGWDFDGLASALVNGLSAGLSGIAFWGSDVGGFFTLSGQELDAELLIRWIELGAVSPLMRTKAEGISASGARRPQVWDPGIVEHWRRWAGFHTRLSPYLLGAAAAYVDTGMPLMRHHCLTDPDDSRAVALDDQFMLGDWLLAAPVLKRGARRRRLYLPAGRWLELASGKVFEGGAFATVAAPLGELPLFVKAGGLLPMLPPEVRSLATPAPRTLHVLAFPWQSSSVRVGRRGVLRSQVEGGTWRLQAENTGFTEMVLEADLGLLGGHRVEASIKGRAPVFEIDVSNP